MEVPSYQIQNVLKVYSKELIQRRFSDINKNFAPIINNVNISTEGKRGSIINKIFSSIVENITSIETQVKIKQNFFTQIEKKNEYRKKTRKIYL